MDEIEVLKRIAQNMPAFEWPARSRQEARDRYHLMVRLRLRGLTQKQSERSDGSGKCRSLVRRPVITDKGLFVLQHSGQG